MNTDHFNAKNILVSALITTGLLGSTLILADESMSHDSFIYPQESIASLIDVQLHNQQFQCNKSGFIINFLPHSKALFTHSSFNTPLYAEYTVLFNKDIAINVYENPSKHFDVMMHDVHIRTEGFTARVNHEDRLFFKV